MATVHSFNVAASEGATQHSVKVTFKSYDEADDATRRRMWDEGVSGVTIKVQGTLRRRLKKGVRGEALSKEAQQAFDAVMSGVRSRGTTVVVQKVRVDATMLKLTREQIDQLVSDGAEVFNIPEGV